MAKVLVIDDDAQLRQMMVRMLVAAEHEVVQAKDGREGLQQFRAHHPTIVVTDILMPEKEGIETIRELRREAPTVKIIAISGGGQSQSSFFLEAAKKLGADAVLLKPFRAAAFMEAVNTLS